GAQAPGRRAADGCAAGAHAARGAEPGRHGPARAAPAECPGHRGRRRARRGLRRPPHRCGVSRPAVAAELLRAHARTLKMPGLARSFDALARQAREERWAYEEYLYETLSAEITSRAASAV